MQCQNYEVHECTGLIKFSGNEDTNVAMEI